MPTDTHKGLQLLTVREAAAMLGQSPYTVYDKIRRGTIPAVRLGPGRAAIRVDADELERYLYARDPEDAA